MIRKISRREFVQLTSVASAGLMLGFAKPQRGTPAPAQVRDLGTFVQIDDAGIVTIWVPKSDMGTGVRTALPMIVAEELDANWSQVRVKQAYVDKKFGRLGTGGSSSVRTTWMPMRQAGATARAMLVAACAAKLGVPADSLTTSDGVITHAASNRSVTYGEVAADAAKLPVPSDVKLKDPAKFKIIGTKVGRVDNHDIVMGKATYGIDVRVPGMLYAVVKRAPMFGGKVASFDDTKTKAVPGVRHVVQIDSTGPELPWNGVAVVADSTWAAMKGRDALDVKWEPGAAASESSESLLKLMTDAATAKPAKRIYDIGNVDSATTSAAKTLDVTYELPFLAHATMEPMNATANVTADGAELWLPTQFPDWAGASVATNLKLDPNKVKVNVTLLGGGFGRRANPDFAIEAALISKAAGKPVHVHWTREDDMQHDYYRPTSRHRIIAGLDPEGRIIAWDHHFAVPAVDAYHHPNAEKIWDGDIGGLDDVPYTVPNYRVNFTNVPSVVPRGWWRSVEYSINGFVTNSFLDEAAVAAGKDPIEYRLSLLVPGRRVDVAGGEPDFPFEVDRLRHVIEVVRDRSGWAKPLGEGRARGFAAMRSFRTYVAEVAEVSITKDGFKLDRVFAVIDCGTAVNPDGVAAQVEGAIVYGLTAALYGEITTKGGEVQQSNFHDYPLLRIGEMPAVDVHIIKSTALPTGTGEPGLPPLAPAVANAIFAATGKRLRSLPLKLV